MTVTSEPQLSESAELAARDRLAGPGHRSAAALASRRICPYLAVDGGGWRSAYPSKDHRCAAVSPPALLAPEKQRRLCLTDEHLACPTFLAAAAAARLELPVPGTGRPSSHPRGSVTGHDTVTRWALVRTMPIVLDHGRVPVSVGRIARNRTGGQLALGGLMAVAFVAIVAARLTGGSGPVVSPSPPVAAALPSASLQVAPSPTTGSAPSVEPTASASPAPTPEPTIVATRTYKVKSGDTLYGIAIHFGTSVKTIRDLNELGNSSVIHAGQVLKIP